MRTLKNCGRYDRGKLRYPSDLTEDEWKLVDPLIRPDKRGGGKRTVVMHEVVDGLMYTLSTGGQWRRSRRTRRRRAQPHDYSTCGPTTAHWRIFTMHFM
jgi:transposase